MVRVNYVRGKPLPTYAISEKNFYRYNTTLKKTTKESIGLIGLMIRSIYNSRE